MTYGYDAASQRTSMVDSIGVNFYGYDKAGRQVSVAYPNTGNLTYNYDVAGNRIGMQDTDNGLTTYSYDGNNRLAGLINPFNEFTTWTYSVLNVVTKQQLANGVSVTYTYNGEGYEESRQYSTATTDLLRQNIFRNSGREIYSVQDRGSFPNSSTTYKYDPARQLTWDQRTAITTYAYDASGNRIQQRTNPNLTNYTINALNQVTLEQAGSNVTTYGYDTNGNRTLSNKNGQLTSFTWDTENRLAGIVYPTGTRDTFIYDGDGQRREKQFSGGTTRFVYDGVNILQTLDGSNGTVAQYTDYPGQWGGLISQRQSGVSSFFGTDVQSNVRMLTDASGAITDSYTTNQFGEMINTTGSTNNPFVFGGQYGYYKDGANQYFIRARSYDSGVGRWLSRDPIGFDGGDWNLYRYSENNPINRIDPSGLAGYVCPGEDSDECREAVKLKKDLCGDKNNPDSSYTCRGEGLDKINRYKGTKKCDHINERIRKADECLRLRTNVTIICFHGVDLVHPDAIPNARIDLENCILEAERACKNSGKPVLRPVPHPYPVPGMAPIPEGPLQFIPPLPSISVFPPVRRPVIGPVPPGYPRPITGPTSVSAQDRALLSLLLALGWGLVQIFSKYPWLAGAAAL